MLFLLKMLLFLLSLFLVLLVLVQRGRGGGLAGALGGMGGQSAFGTKAGDLFTKITIVTAAIWILLCAAAVKSFKPAQEPANPFAGLPGPAPVTTGAPATDGAGAALPPATGGVPAAAPASGAPAAPPASGTGS